MNAVERPWRREDDSGLCIPSIWVASPGLCLHGPHSGPLLSELMTIALPHPDMSRPHRIAVLEDRASDCPTSTKILLYGDAQMDGC